MVVGLIIACEVGFWVLLLGGLGLRYLLRLRRVSAVVLACVPLVDVVLLVTTVVDLRRGGEASTWHGLAAVYIGCSVAYGRQLVRWADQRVAHRFAGGPAPVRPPKYGMARARYEWVQWGLTVVAAVVAVVLLQLAVWLVGDGGDTTQLTRWQERVAVVTGIHLLIAASYTVFPKRRPAAGADREAGEKAPETAADVGGGAARGGRRPGGLPWHR